ncbi:ABC transporter permease [Vagococcus silagei]|uniref:ABC transporter permease n=1 Tax=Vagococcus silagei TaxID=2508885 RepID=UPI0013A63536|nr:ABC transporter permease [Vagococcus silagei]
MARTLYGTRLSLLIAVSATAIEFGIGISYGLISGWKGGKTDLYMQRFVEFISSIPTLVIVILMLLVFKPGVTSILIAMGLTGWITMSRVIRAETIKLKQQEFVTAAIILGEKPTQIARHHLLPNLMDVILTQMMLNIPAAIFFESFLSFIGIGIQVPNASLGSLLSEGYQVFRLTPHVLIFPSIILCLLMIFFNLFGHGLRDVLDPKI